MNEQEYDAMRRRSDESSHKLGEKLLQGWKMLADTCPNPGCYVPMLESKSGVRMCVACTQQGPPVIVSRRSAEPLSTPLGGSLESKEAESTQRQTSIAEITAGASSVTVMDAPANWQTMTPEELRMFAGRRAGSTAGDFKPEAPVSMPPRDIHRATPAVKQEPSPLAAPAQPRVVPASAPSPAPVPEPTQRETSIAEITPSASSVMVMDAPANWQTMTPEELRAFAARRGGHTAGESKPEAPVSMPRREIRRATPAVKEESSPLAARAQAPAPVPASAPKAPKASPPQDAFVSTPAPAPAQAQAQAASSVAQATRDALFQAMDDAREMLTSSRDLSARSAAAKAIGEYAEALQKLGSL